VGGVGEKWARRRRGLPSWGRAVEETSETPLASSLDPAGDYRILGRRLLGPRRFRRLDEKGAAPDLSAALTEKVDYLRAKARFSLELEKGRDLPTALVSSVRALLRVGDPAGATALAVSVGRWGSGEVAHWLGLGLVVQEAGFGPEAFTHFSQVPAAELATHVAVEAAGCAFEAGTPEARALALELAEHRRLMPTEAAVGVAGLYLAFGYRAEALTLLDEVEARSADDEPDSLRLRCATLRRWATQEPPSTTARITVGVLSHQHPDLDAITTDVGVALQGLAALGAWARCGGLRFDPTTELGGVATALRDRMLGEAGAAPATEVTVIPVSRDLSVADAVPPGTWVITAGDHVDPVFGVRQAFPYHPEVRPLFVSFHLRSHEVLNDDTIAYLRSYGPVGCRDWTTVDMLLSVGVEAFFTGCLTTTLGALAPRPTGRGTSSSATLVVDCASYSPTDTETIVSSFDRPDLGRHSLAEIVREADETVRSWRERGARVVTSHLQAALTGRALGLEVDFRPDLAGDIRYDGLLEPIGDPAGASAMAEDLQTLLDPVLAAVAAGTSEDEVYARWREAVAPRVAEARERHARRVEVDDRLDEVAAAIETVRRRQFAFGPSTASIAPASVTQVALSLDQNLRAMLPTTVESLVANATGPLRLWITTRGLDPTYFEWFSAAFPQVPVTFIDYTGIEYGTLRRKFRHISVTTMDRLLLPEVLADLDRLVYVDIDTVSEGDVCELGALDLRGAPLAAKCPDHRTAFRVWRDAGNLLDAPLASELRRTLAARHPVTFRTLNAGVLVMDLARMRADRFVQTFLPMVTRYGLNDQDILNAYAGPHFLKLEPKWNAIPRQEVIRDPGIVHYVGGAKPWGEKLVPYGDHWLTWQRRVSDRAGAPPASGVV
jgi:lipopolysaccharide biosynthesis glycosyltransferase